MQRNDWTGLKSVGYWVAMAWLASSLIACTDSSLPEAVKRYHAQRDYSSLVIISQSLQVGMSQETVVARLGAPDYSPTEGLFYYASEKITQNPQQPDQRVTHGLIVDYRKGETLTRHLQAFSLEPIGE